MNDHVAAVLRGIADRLVVRSQDCLEASDTIAMQEFAAEIRAAIATCEQHDALVAENEQLKAELSVRGDYVNETIQAKYNAVNTLAQRMITSLHSFDAGLAKHYEDALVRAIKGE